MHFRIVIARALCARGNLVQAVTILPIAFLQFSLVLRDSHVASLLGMTNLGAGAVDGNAFKFVTALGAQGAPLQTQLVHTMLTTVCTSLQVQHLAWHTPEFMQNGSGRRPLPFVLFFY